MHSRPGLSHRNASGFTLAELMIAIALVALLMAFLLPSLHNAREVARKHADASNLKQLTNSVGQYALSNNNEAPQGYGALGYRISLGYTHGEKGGSYIKYRDFGWANGFAGLGLLYTSGIVQDARLLYSPTGQAQYQRYNGWNASGGQEPSYCQLLCSVFMIRRLVV